MAKKKNDEVPEKELPNGETEQQTEEAAEASAEVSEEPVPAEEPAVNPLEAELAAEKDKYLRLAAEYDNFRKRSQKERDAMFSDIRADTILKLLPVYDNLARALSHECSDEAFYKGVEMIMTQLESIFEGMGVKEIPALGEKFDPSLHNAVMHVEDEAHGENEIIQEFEKGFKLGDRVIRFSTVQVAN